MRIGLLSELSTVERRVSLSPSAVRTLVVRGHEVMVESGAGSAARFSDDEYRSVGARIVFDREEVYGRGELILKVSSLRPADVSLVRKGQVVMAFHHLAASGRDLVEALLARGATLVGYEVVEDENGDLPILHAMSEIAGQLAVHIAAHYLETRAGGRGILLGGATGIPPAHVVIIGAGTVGLWAAKTAVGNRAQVTVLDTSLTALRRIDETLGRSVVTEVSTPRSVARAAAYADTLIGAILVRGEKAPHVVTREMVKDMKSGSVIVDVAIDQGGCIETSRPSTVEDPIYVDEGVTHYCVPNMTSTVARTASIALTHTVLPYARAIADTGIEAAIRELPGLAAGVYAYEGAFVTARVARLFQMKHDRLSDLVGAPQFRGE